jgi:hypothetical protein
MLLDLSCMFIFKQSQKEMKAKFLEHFCIIRTECTF